MAPQHTVARAHRLYIARPPAGFLNGTEINGVALPLTGRASTLLRVKLSIHGFISFDACGFCA